MASTKTKSTEKKEPPIFDDSGTGYFAKFTNVMEYIYKLFVYYVIGSIKDHKLEFSFLLGLIIYIIIASIIFAKNPYDIITDNNEGLSILLMLFGGFLIVLLMFFYSRKKELFENEEEKGTLSFLGKIFTSIVSVGLIITLVYVFFNLSSYFSDFSSFLLMGINILIILGIITIAFKFFGLLGQGEPGEQSPSWPKLLIKMITYFPCLMMDVIEYIKYQYQITTKPIVILFAVELLLIGLYFVFPWLMEKIMYHNTSQLIERPENLNIQQNLGTFQDVNYTTPVGSSSSEFSYHYAISSWFYINSNPPETNPHYDEYTSILNVGDKPDIQFNVLKNKLRIKMKTQGKIEKILYETTKFPMQKWNNIIINYDGSTFDIFINNELVSSTPGVIPYKSNTVITSGTQGGLYGGICNVKYFRNNISRGKINWLYNSINNLNPPII